MTADRATRLEMRGIAKRFGATVALDGVDLRVFPGEVVALVGENGAGKSTLMKVLSGAHRPDSGEMWLDGQPFRPANPLAARRSGVAMIYQELSLASHLTVEENILLGMEPQRCGWIRAAEVRRRAVEALAQFAPAGIRPDQTVGRLTVAAQQLVEIARALAVGCRVLILDEPTSSLGGPDVKRLFELIGQLKAQGLAIVYISHFLEEVKCVSDRVSVLRDGRTVGEGATRDTPIERMVSWMVGREVRDLYPRSPRQPGEVLLEITGLAGRGGKPVDAALELRRGEVVGIAGLMGAGRTEFLRCLFGLDAVRSGRVRVGGYSGPASPVRRWEQGVGMLSEDRKQEGLALTLSLADNVTLPRLGTLGRYGWVMPRRQQNATERWIERLGIRCRGPTQSVQALSGGNQQKVAMARLLQSDVDVLLLDEPTRGIDVAAKATIYGLIDELAAGRSGDGTRSRAILMVSSYLPELLGVCDRVAVMCRGRLGPARPVSAVNEHTLMLEATRQDWRHGETSTIVPAMTRAFSVLCGLWLAALGSLFTATAADLGSPAAPLQISEWIKGGPVSLADGRGKSVYVIEFWATWCPPCRTSIPHLTELQKKFKSKNVVVVGISDETADKVKPFVEKMGSQMDYVVALDDQRKSSQGYMAAFQQNGIPHAFIVDQQGRVVWHGHPMAGLDEAVDQVVQGKFDIAKAKKAAQMEDNVQKYFQLVSQEDKDPQASALGKEILDSAAAAPSMLNEFAWIILTHPRVKHRDVPLALRAAKMAYDDTKGKDLAIADTYGRALFDSGKKDEAIRLQKEAIAACQDADLRKQLEKTLEEYEAPARPAPATQ